jgi:NADPH-dependent ferric siderophore reductase
VTTRAATHTAEVLGREALSGHLLRLVLGGEGLAGFASTGVPDEWVGLVVPGQFQSRYYTVRDWDAAARRLVVDVVVHDQGLVTEWAARPACVGEQVTVTDPKGSFTLPEDAAWVLLVGDLTALPAIARTREHLASHHPGLPVRTWAEAPDDDLAAYLPATGPDGAPLGDVTWVRPPDGAPSGLAAVVEGIDWPEGEGYFWMAGESAQMRAIRKHLMRDRALPGTAYDVMGYWRGGATRQPRAVDPGPIWRAGKAAGKSDEEIWADYDAAREQEADR